jgi:hypothetical protein
VFTVYEEQPIPEPPTPPPEPELAEGEEPVRDENVFFFPSSRSNASSARPLPARPPTRVERRLSRTRFFTPTSPRPPATTVFKTDPPTRVAATIRPPLSSPSSQPPPPEPEEPPEPLPPLEFAVTELQLLLSMATRINDECAIAPVGMHITDANGHIVYNPLFHMKYPEQLASYAKTAVGGSKTTLKEARPLYSTPLFSCAPVRASRVARRLSRTFPLAFLHPPCALPFKTDARLTDASCPSFQTRSRTERGG